MIPLNPDPPNSDEAPDAGPRLRGPRALRVRLGPLCLPCGVVAWGISLAAHAAVLIVGLTASRPAGLDSPPGIAMAGGDAAAAGQFFVSAGQSAYGAGVEAPPGVASPPAEPTLLEPPEDTRSDDAVAREVGGPTAAHALLDSADDVTTDQTALLGVPMGETVSPVTRRPWPAGGAPGGAGTAPDGGAAGPGNPSAGSSSGSASEDIGAEAGGAPGVPGGIADASLPAPVYPGESRRRGEEGTVVVEVSVEADGTASAITVVSDSGFPRLAEASIAAVNKAHFRPAFRAGRPVACRVRIPFRFRLRNGR